MKTIIAFVASLLLLGCNGITTAKHVNNMTDNTTKLIQELIATSNESLVIGDSLLVGGNPLRREEAKPAVKRLLDDEEQETLAQKTKLEISDSTCLIGVRQIGARHVLAAYLVPQSDENPYDFKVYFVCYDDETNVTDVLGLRQMHTSEHQGPMRLGGNRFYTTDATVTFDDTNHFTVHRVMTLTSLYLKNHTLTEAWRVEWDNHFEITEDGHFHFKGQQETYRSDGVDDHAIEEYKSRFLSN